MVIGVVVLLAGCANSGGAVSNSQSPTSSPSSTVGPSSPSITVHPTPSPSPPDGQPGWVAYDLFIVAADDRLIAGITKWEEALLVQDSTAAALQSSLLSSYVQDDLMWLRGHEPDECYAAHWQLQITALGHFQEALDAYQRWIDSGREEDHQTFLEGLHTSAQTFRDVLSLPGADESCNPVHTGLARIGQKVSIGDHYVTVLEAEQWPGEGFITPRTGYVFFRWRSNLKPSSSGNRSCSARTWSQRTARNINESCSDARRT